MFILVLMFALANADAVLPDLDLDSAGTFLLETNDLVPLLPTAQVYSVNWMIPVSPNHITINVGDSVMFSWIGMHGLVMFGDANGASLCDIAGATSLSPIMDGGSFTWTAATAGDFYFACPVNNGGHCMQGMNLWVTVVTPVGLPLAITGNLGITWGNGCTLCGASCLSSLALGGLGVCNSNLNCVARKLIPPICGNAGCPILSCGLPPLCLGNTFLFTPTDARGCPICPVCSTSNIISPTTYVPCVGDACVPLPCCPLIIPEGYVCRHC
jgi:plastocyanin